ETPERAAVGREEQDRVSRLGRSRGCPRRRVRACELEERRGSGAVVVCAGARAGVVAVGDDDDQVVRPAFAECENVLERNRAASGDFRVKTLTLRPQTVLCELLSDPGSGGRRIARAGRAARELVREGLCGLRG